MSKMKIFQSAQPKLAQSTVFAFVVSVPAESLKNVLSRETGAELVSPFNIVFPGKLSRELRYARVVGLRVEYVSKMGSAIPARGSRRTTVGIFCERSQAHSTNPCR